MPPLMSGRQHLPMLCLLDIDGTLIKGGKDSAHDRALIAAAHRCSHLPVSQTDWDRIEAVEVSGRTDIWMLHQMLLRHGLDDEAFDSILPGLIETATRNFFETKEKYPSPEAFPGAIDEIETLGRDAGIKLALLTGNIEAIARVKVSEAGFGMFALDQGAFGSDAEDRDSLALIAIERARYTGPVVVVGDTPQDISCARAAGAKAIAVLSGAFRKEDLMEADILLPSVRELGEGLRALGLSL